MLQAGLFKAAELGKANPGCRPEQSSPALRATVCWGTRSLLPAAVRGSRSPSRRKHQHPSPSAHVSPLSSARWAAPGTGCFPPAAPHRPPISSRGGRRGRLIDASPAGVGSFSNPVAGLMAPSGSGGAAHTPLRPLKGSATAGPPPLPPCSLMKFCQRQLRARRGQEAAMKRRLCAAETARLPRPPPALPAPLR